MINMLNNMSDNYKFTTDFLKNSEVLNTKKTENENEVIDGLHTKKDDKRFDSFERQRQEKTAGTYHITKDDYGKLKVLFDGANNVSDSKSDEGSANVINTNQKVDIVDKVDENDKIVSDDKIDKKDKANTDDKVNSKDENDKEDEKPKVVVTTFDLSAVEREIKKLKQQQQQLQQELSSAPEEQKRQIQAELDRVTQELEKKDTDAYRNSHDNSRQYTLS